MAVRDRHGRKPGALECIVECHMLYVYCICIFSLIRQKTVLISDRDQPILAIYNRIGSVKEKVVTPFVWMSILLSFVKVYFLLSTCVFYIKGSRVQDLWSLMGRAFFLSLSWQQKAPEMKLQMRAVRMREVSVVDKSTDVWQGVWETEVFWILFTKGRRGWMGHVDSKCLNYPQ